ncbi:MAG: hypothetical protein KGJ36_06900 [Acidobacteriota bacterium]|nr:hypothetical protein [Acidobacteriota bacterium]
MRFWHVAAGVAVLAATGVAVGGARSSSAGPPAASLCSPAALSAAFDGALGLKSLDGWGCQGDYAYAYATIGTEPNLISVTEVLAFSPSSATWAIVARATYCVPGRLPDLVYRRGCFSN